MFAEGYQPIMNVGVGGGWGRDGSKGGTRSKCLQRATSQGGGGGGGGWGEGGGKGGMFAEDYQPRGGGGGGRRGGEGGGKGKMNVEGGSG